MAAPEPDTSPVPPGRAGQAGRAPPIVGLRREREVLAEGEIAVPRLGMVRASAGFRLVAAMNPSDAIGTARVSHAIADRICRVVLGYQDAAAERAITTAITGCGSGQVVDFAVTLTRATREHRDMRMGASVRGAIDLVVLMTGLARLRGETGMVRATARDA